ncbi:MAG: glycosyl hydrolase, partial [Paludibacter sp.]
MITKKSIILASLAILLAFVSINAQPLKSGFVNPPESARPWVMWFWVNGNITKTGITADLEAMKRVGIGGVIIFDVIKDAPLGANEFGTANWYELFKFMLQEANRLGLKVNMNNDAGWCGSGGPWVPVEKSMQKIVWTETIAQGSNTFKAKLKQPLAVKNYYEDIMVLAFPTPEGDDKKLSDYNPEVKCSTTTAPFEGKNLIDGNSKTNIELAIPTLQKPQIIDFVYPQPFTSRFMTIDLLKNKWSVRGTLMVSEDGLNFKTVKEFEGAAPTISFEFNEQTARWYRISFNEIVNKQIVLKKIGISDFDISNTRLHAIPQKAMFKPIPDFLSVNNIIKIPTDYQSIDTKFTVPINKVLNITDKMTSDGTIAWDVPQGKWTILRIGHTTTGKVNHPAPVYEHFNAQPRLVCIWTGDP